ncbi:hypothetical protein B296_00022579 [Ensete ventricosum]|uniref:Uncharacterized protein n=1 Tax=Ensete ventricosum TaxID=4639 RepID=A0A427AL76_ENSVE|nr:hypothetical protein B296_00022579 [Ensete ventricosum]
MEKRDSGSKGEDADVSTAMVAISNAPVLKMLCSQASGPILCSMKSYRCRSAQGKKFHVEGADLLGKGFSSMKRRCSRLCGSNDEEEEGESTATLALGLSTGGCGAGLLEQQRRSARSLRSSDQSGGAVAHWSWCGSGGARGLWRCRLSGRASRVRCSRFLWDVV